MSSCCSAEKKVCCYTIIVYFIPLKDINFSIKGKYAEN